LAAQRESVTAQLKCLVFKGFIILFWVAGKFNSTIKRRLANIDLVATIAMQYTGQDDPDVQKSLAQIAVIGRYQYSKTQSSKLCGELPIDFKIL